MSCAKRRPFYSDLNVLALKISRYRRDTFHFTCRKHFRCWVCMTQFLPCRNISGLNWACTQPPSLHMAVADVLVSSRGYPSTTTVMSVFWKDIYSACVFINTFMHTYIYIHRFEFSMISSIFLHNFFLKNNCFFSNCVTKKVSYARLLLTKFR